MKTLAPRPQTSRRSTVILKTPYKAPAFTNVLTIDLEDWFHVSNFENYLDKSRWDMLPSRIPYTLPKLLDLLAEYDARATFFCLGWVAKRFPSLIKRIQEEGHEIASHGDEHQRVTTLTESEFRNQLMRSKDTIEQITGEKIYGFRAPSYSLRESTKWAFNVLLECGFEYDSSIFPFGNRRAPELCDSRFPCYLYTEAGRLTEYPLSTHKFLGANLPIAGGGYFRLLPYEVIRWSISKLNQDGRTAIMYMHPWEIDPDQPRVHQASWLAKFRHYHQLSQTESKLTALIRDFSFGSLRDVFWTERTGRYGVHPQR